MKPTIKTEETTTFVVPEEETIESIGTEGNYACRKTILIYLMHIEQSHIWYIFIK